MHPALSVIFFTTATGAGYGILFLAGIFGALGVLPPERWLGVALFGVAVAAVTAGLISSTLHLGHPERAWRALGQWRSSWLSREGVAAVLTYLPVIAYAFGWIIYERNDGVCALLGLLAAASAAVTVYCTAMIYVSLRPIPDWSNGWVPPNYFAAALATGALWTAAIGRAFAIDGWVLPAFATIAVFAAALLKLGYWRYIDGRPAAATAGSATGLGRFGRVRLFEAPHTQPNYLLKEMGFQIARKHAARLRAIAVVAGYLLPLLLVLATLVLPWPGLAAPLLFAAALLAGFGVFVERWLFFAEARHTVTLYYGAEAA